MEPRRAPGSPDRRVQRGCPARETPWTLPAPGERVLSPGAPMASAPPIQASEAPKDIPIRGASGRIVSTRSHLGPVAPPPSGRGSNRCTAPTIGSPLAGSSAKGDPTARALVAPPSTRKARAEPKPPAPSPDGPWSHWVHRPEPPSLSRWSMVTAPVNRPCTVAPTRLNASDAEGAPRAAQAGAAATACPCWSSAPSRTGTPGPPVRVSGPLHQEFAPPVPQEPGIPTRAAPRTSPPPRTECPAGAPASRAIRPSMEGSRATDSPKPGGRPPAADRTSSAGARIKPSRTEGGAVPACGAHMGSEAAAGPSQSEAMSPSQGAARRLNTRCRVPGPPQCSPTGRSLADGVPGRWALGPELFFIM